MCLDPCLDALRLAVADLGICFSSCVMDIYEEMEEGFQDAARILRLRPLGSCFIQRKDDRANYSVHVLRYIVIPKTDHFVAKRFKTLCSFFVVLHLLQVLTAVQFDDELLLDAHEIGNKVSDGVLTAKVDAQLVVANSCPQFALSGREFFS